MKNNYFKYHIFCQVIDNYGDFGVCFRLAKQLVNEYNKQVFLWVDNVNILKKFLDVNADEIKEIKKNNSQNLNFKIWNKNNLLNELNNINIINNIFTNSIIIEAFCCDLDAELLNFINNENKKNDRIIIISLDYLGLEKWILDCHLLPSLLSEYKYIKKYFFFPSYLEKSGGLIREKYIKHNITNSKNFSQNLVENFHKSPFKISLFFYQQNSQLLLTFINALNLLSEKYKFYIEINCCDFSNTNLNLVKNFTFSKYIKCNCIKFLSQQNYDKLLQNCHLNFVRGEDSFIRAFWSNNLFIWQIYTQQNNLHLTKLNEFLNYYFSITNFDTNLQTNLNTIFLFWNQNNNPNYQNSTRNIKIFSDLMLDIIENYEKFQQQHQYWLNFLHRQNSLTENLINFVKNQEI